VDAVVVADKPAVADIAVAVVPDKPAVVVGGIVDAVARVAATLIPLVVPAV
jgi:hypothetical protein